MKSEPILHSHAKTQGRKTRQVMLCWLPCVALLAVVTILAGCSKPADHSQHSTTPSPAKSAPVFWCPMHPEVTSTDPNAECDKCGGMKLLPKEDKPSQPSTTPKPTHTAGKYTCPMHPQILADKPGDCPICHMALVPVTQTSSEGGIRVSPEVRQTIGLKLGTVEKLPLRREIRAAARIVPDETRQHRVTTKTEGWVDKLFVNVTGQQVKAGDPLLTIYSPELLAAQREFLAASPDLAAAAKHRLQLLDVTDAQIAKLNETRQPEKFLTVYAPATGWVTDKMIVAGQKIMPGESLMTVTDLTTVWADAELFQSDLAAVQVGATLELNVAGQIVPGKVTFVSPTLDPMTRTAKARAELPNPTLVLKPETLATARIFVDLGEAVAVPIAAVMRTGEHDYVFRDAGDDKLEPVMVKLGARSGDYFQLLGDELKPGDQVVVSANFLIDSESQVKGALSGMQGEHRHK